MKFICYITLVRCDTKNTGDTTIYFITYSKQMNYVKIIKITLKQGKKKERQVLLPNLNNKTSTLILYLIFFHKISY